MDIGSPAMILMEYSAMSEHDWCKLYSDDGQD